MHQTFSSSSSVYHQQEQTTSSSTISVDNDHSHLLSPRRTSLRTGEDVAGAEDQVNEDFEDDFENDDYVRLNRKRNIPIRKTSFKRKANKSLSDEKLLLTSTGNNSTSAGELGQMNYYTATSSSNLSSNEAGAGNGSSQQMQNHQLQHQNQSHRQLTKLSSDSNVLLASTTSASSLSAFSSSGYNTANSDSASSFSKLRLYDHADYLHQQQQQQSSQLSPLNHGQLQQRYSVSDDVGGQSANLPSPTTTTGPIQKAKATFRNIMGGKSSLETSSSGTNRRLLKQSVSVKYGSEGGVEEASISGGGGYGSNSSSPHYTTGKSLSNSDLGGMAAGGDHFISNSSFYSAYQPNATTNSSSSQQYDLLHQSLAFPPTLNLQQQQPTLSHLVVANSTNNKPSSKPRMMASGEGNFTLLSRHTIRKEEHFKSGEICAICENSIMTEKPESHYKCTECRQLFHNKCFHLSSDIPCIKEGYSSFSAHGSSAHNHSSAHGSLSVLNGKFSWNFFLNFY